MGTSAGNIAVVTVVTVFTVALFAFGFLYNIPKSQEERDKDYLNNRGISASVPIIHGGSKRRKRSYKNRKSKRNKNK